MQLAAIAEESLPELLFAVDPRTGAVRSATGCQVEIASPPSTSPLDLVRNTRRESTSSTAAETGSDEDPSQAGSSPSEFARTDQPDSISSAFAQFGSDAYLSQAAFFSEQTNLAASHSSATVGMLVTQTRSLYGPDHVEQPSSTEAIKAKIESLVHSMAPNPEAQSPESANAEMTAGRDGQGSRGSRRGHLALGGDRARRPAGVLAAKVHPALDDFSFPAKPKVRLPGTLDLSTPAGYRQLKRHDQQASDQAAVQTSTDHQLIAQATTQDQESPEKLQSRPQRLQEERGRESPDQMQQVQSMGDRKPLTLFPGDQPASQKRETQDPLTSNKSQGTGHDGTGSVHSTTGHHPTQGVKQDSTPHLMPPVVKAMQDYIPPHMRAPMTKTKQDYIPPHMRGKDNGLAEWAINEIKQAKALDSKSVNLPTSFTPATKAKAESNEADPAKQSKAKASFSMTTYPGAAQLTTNLEQGQAVTASDGNQARQTGPLMSERAARARDPRGSMSSADRCAYTTLMENGWMISRPKAKEAEDTQDQGRAKSASGWSSNGAAVSPETNEKHELADWDGSLMPAPVDWELRPEWRDKAMQKHMVHWLKRIEELQRGPDVTQPSFRDGDAHTNQLNLLSPPRHEETLPNPEKLENPGQTSSVSMMNFRIKSLNRSLVRRDKRYSRVMRRVTASPAVEEAGVDNPYAPKVQMYIRPARRADVAACKDIYQHYCKVSVVAPELTISSVDNMYTIFDDVDQLNLPWIVAVEGSLDHKGQEPREGGKILGYAFADDFGGPNSAFQFTVEMQVFTHADHTRLGVGKCLVDQLLYLLDPLHTFPSGCRFLTSDLRWQEPGGRRRVAKVLCNIPYVADEPAEMDWQRKWFLENQFEEVGKLTGVGAKFRKW